MVSRPLVAAMKRVDTISPWEEIMTQAGVLYDLTSFCHNPSRTGIQRVTLEVAMAWRGPLPLVPFLVDRDAQPRLLPPGACDHLAEFFGRKPGSPDKAKSFF